MIKKPGTAEWELERIGAPERTPQPESNPSFVPAAVAAFQVPLGLRRRSRSRWTPPKTLDTFVLDEDGMPVELHHRDPSGVTIFDVVCDGEWPP